MIDMTSVEWQKLREKVEKLLKERKVRACILVYAIEEESGKLTAHGFTAGDPMTLLQVHAEADARKKTLIKENPELQALTNLGRYLAM